jgi:hypothetical protein
MLIWSVRTGNRSRQYFVQHRCHCWCAFCKIQARHEDELIERHKWFEWLKPRILCGLQISAHHSRLSRVQAEMRAAESKAVLEGGKQRKAARQAARRQQAEARDAEQRRLELERQAREERALQAQLARQREQQERRAAAVRANDSMHALSSAALAQLAEEFGEERRQLAVGVDRARASGLGVAACVPSPGQRLQDASTAGRAPSSDRPSRTSGDSWRFVAGAQHAEVVYDEDLPSYCSDGARFDVASELRESAAPASCAHGEFNIITSRPADSGGDPLVVFEPAGKPLSLAQDCLGRGEVECHRACEASSEAGQLFGALTLADSCSSLFRNSGLTVGKIGEEAALEGMRASGFLAALSNAVCAPKRRRL